MFDLCGLVFAGCEFLMALLVLNGLQTPLMLAAMHGKISCVRKLLEAGANVCEKSQLCFGFGFPLNFVFHVWSVRLMWAIVSGIDV